MFEHLDGCRFSVPHFEEPISSPQSASVNGKRKMNLSNCEIFKKKLKLLFYLDLGPVNAEILCEVEKMPSGRATCQFLGHGFTFPRGPTMRAIAMMLELWRA